RLTACVTTPLRALAPAMCLGILVLVPPAQAQAPPPTQTQRIDYLISSVESMGAAQFIRNGTTYDAKAAADHLRLKRRMAGASCATAENFIRYCATQSSVSGKPYEIRLPDGTVVSSAAFLQGKLADFDRSHAPGG
ncbi:MAG TPA: DUF5329 family protein, partial [Steroidobacteraceae bacterium]|nr:DUF5329 family protein [Steroidobacteraceae bacterium]